MIITIAGPPGSGKSTAAKFLAKTLQFKHYSAGDVMREIAKERGISLLELSEAAETDHTIDISIDEKTKELGKQDNFVMDSRLAWYWIPNSAKIYLKVSDEEGAQRIFKDKRAHEHENVTFEDTLAATKKRTTSENQRFQEIYGIDPTKEENYDIIIDTAGNTPDETNTLVLNELKKRNLI